jgi:hypothetical protein
MGTEFLVGLAVFAVLAALRTRNLGLAVAIAFAIGLLAAIVFGTNVLNTIYRQIAIQFPAASDPGDITFAYGAAIGAALVGLAGLLFGARGGTASGAVGGLIAGAILGALAGLLAVGLVRLAFDPGSRPMVVGIVLWGVVGGIAGLVLGARAGGGEGAIAGLFIGLLAGGLFGAFSAITFTWHVAVAIGLSLFLGLAPAIAGAYAASGGIDVEALKDRYIPQTTIDTTKETLEWAKAQRPGARRS